MYKKNIVLIIISLLFMGCNAPKNTKEAFNQYYQKNIDSCVEAITGESGLDSISAHNKCLCMLNTLYQIDSTFILKDAKDIEVFIQNNRQKINDQCDSININ